MADDSELEIAAELKLLRKAYAGRLPSRMDEITNCWLEARRNNWRMDYFENLHMLAHKLAGSGATYGYSQIGDSARTLEQKLKNLLSSGITPDNSQIHELDRNLQNLYQIIQNTYRASQFDDTILNSIEKPYLSLDTQFRTIIIIEPDPDEALALAQQIGYFGYDVHIFKDIDEASFMLEQSRPVAIITDIIFADDNLSGTQMAAQVIKNKAQNSRLIFLSSRSDIAARLHAVRAEGYAFLTKPVDITSLIDRLDQLTGTRYKEPYRVMIIDDDAEVASAIAATLRSAPNDLFETLILTNPLKVLAPLTEFNPDLILLDMYMPRAKGQEIAMIIRQLDAFLTVPIVFLSGESSEEHELEAITSGGDDFLSKQVLANHLIYSIKARIERSRSLRSIVVRDGLTGLLNHTKTKEQLDIEVSRTRRRNGKLSMAMIDIDHFKLVNDTYGHPTGDRVLKSLSRLLQQRLRRTDIIGRFGGEEFAIILLDTDAQAAFKVINEIREGFAQIRHQSQDHEFSVTFSCGIASFPEFGDASSLNDAADKALYEAKDAGRNRVNIAEQYLF
ncbi:MAG: diguanylate cyclase [Chloroflexi bacterium]|uniref:Diguanylate cyclase n=1 Tax=Candidatus Chlorohelix allophototropha TaxID=3003348 RepID=A0A8T7LVV2_9CHLR|nr:diguanylate cyclase [Chloroflexota bacterium]WJW66196.1 diguanylate cyclase [Chloroflexota bacterium L227-S17]